ncbi:MAG: class I SAM-dependent methyltransferase [Verrucomicrobiota bacterium]
MSESIYTSGDYSAKNAGYHVEDSAWKAENLHRMMVRHDLRPKTVCEIGCGAGEVLLQLKQRAGEGARYSGYDISPQAHELCQERAGDHLEFFCQDLLEVKRDPFDLMLCIDVFEHVDDYIGFLRQLRSHGRKHLFHIPLDMAAQMVARGRPIMHVREKLGHLHYFNADTALASLTYAGYRVEDHFYTFRPKSRKARLLALPRRVLFSLNQRLTVRIMGGFSLLVLADGGGADANG